MDKWLDFGGAQRFFWYISSITYVYYYNICVYFFVYLVIKSVFWEHKARCWISLKLFIFV